MALNEDILDLGTMDVIADLPTNTYKLSTLHYPDKLGSDRLGHYVNFYINTPNNTLVNYAPPNSSNLGTTFVGNNVNAANPFGTGDSVANINKSTDFEFSTPNIKNLPKGIQDFVNKASNLYKENVGSSISDTVKGVTDILFKGGTTHTVGAISLYMPDTISTSQQAIYNNKSLTDSLQKLGPYIAGGTAVGSAVDNMVNGSGGFWNGVKQVAGKPGGQELFAGKVNSLLENKNENLTDIIMSKSNYAINPIMNVIFQDMGFRTFQYDFTFSPRNEKEADSVRQIIQMFKLHQVPELNPNTLGRYYITPSTFDIEYMFKGGKNKNLHSISTCVLKTVFVDYSPTGWTAYEDGMPVQTRLILSFEETEMMTKKRISEGY